MIAAIALAALANLTVTVPMNIVQHEPLVQVKIDGHGPYWAIVDTGTDPSVIDVYLARQLGKRGSSGRVSGGGTKQLTVFETEIGTLEVGSLRQRHVAAIAVPLESISKKIGVSIAAVLGYSFLQGRVVQFDYSHRQFGFAPSPTALLRQIPAQCRSTLAFRYDDDVLVDGVRINGSRTVANMDTGSNGFASITPEATARLGLDRLPKTAAANEGFNGAYKSGRGLLATLGVGKRTFINVPATFWVRGTGHDGKPFGVNIGNRLLSRLNPIFDFVAHRLYITACASAIRKK